MRVNIFKKLESIKNKRLKHRILDKVLDFNIPFNRRLKFKIKHLSPEQVIVISPAVVARRNHIKGAHACALATLGEYPAGLVLAQNLSVEKFRFILKELSMDYEKQGRGQLTAICSKKDLPEPHSDEESWYQMQTIITNSDGDLVATCKTKWQIKPWKLVRS